MVKDFIRQLWNVPRALMLAVLIALAFLFIAENGNKAKDKIFAFLKQRWTALFLAYLAFILTETVFSRQITNPYQSILKSFAFLEKTEWNKEIIENIVLFIPYSFLYLQAFSSSRPWKSVLLLSCITTVFIEICQLMFWLGKFQIADIIHNIIGGIVGYIIWIAVKAIKGKLPPKASDGIVDKEQQ